LPHAGGQKPKLKPEQLEIVRQLVSSNNDAILEDLCDRFYKKTQLVVSRATMGRILYQLNLTRKKKRFTLTNKKQKGLKDYERNSGN
jgi:transposase